MSEIATETFGPMEGYPDDNPKTVHGLTKPSTFAIPPIAILHLGQAMDNGRQKYGLMNWRERQGSGTVPSSSRVPRTSTGCPT